ncbi:MAG: hypothetical protein ACKOET_06880 [Verrucomicrobiota bacterium]
MNASTSAPNGNLNRLTAYVLRYGRAVFCGPDGDPENGPCAPEYVGHRLGQVWAHSFDPGSAPLRLNRLPAD